MRQVAHHIYVGELLAGQYEEREGWEPNVMHTGRGSVSRVNIIGTLVPVENQNVLDDGTGKITLRAFEAVPGLDESSLGQIVQVIGRPRQYQQQLFLVPEVVRPVSADWAAVRRAELGDVKQFAAKQEPAPVPQPQQDDSLTDSEKILNIINELDAGDGVQVEAIITKSGLDSRAEQLLDQLLMQGDIFEIKPGVVKVL